MQTTQKTLRTIIISNLLILSLLTLSSCSQAVTDNPTAETTVLSAEGEANATEPDMTITTSDSDVMENENTTAAEISQDSTEQQTSPEVTVYLENPSEDAETKDTLLPEEIEICINKLSEGGLIIEGFEYDIDFDGNQELLCPFMALLKIYKKTDNVIYEKTAGGNVFQHVICDDLNTLQTYEDENEKYSYFVYSYDNGAVMRGNVLVAIKYDSESNKYIAENLISWGRLDFDGENTSQYSRPFFRKGWDKGDISTDESENDISQEEFLEIYNKYENLPAWDEYLY